MKAIEIKIRDYNDRRKMVEALVNSGHAVWVRVVDGEYTHSDKSYFVCFTDAPEEVKS